MNDDDDDDDVVAAVRDSLLYSFIIAIILPLFYLYLLQPLVLFFTFEND